jgi:hypothetical protein
MHSNTISLNYIVSVDAQVEVELALYISQWQRHYDLMTHQEHQIRELLFEKGYDVSMEFLQAVETGQLDGDDEKDPDLLDSIGALSAAEEDKSRILADEVIRQRVPLEASYTRNGGEPSWTERVVDVPVSDAVMTQLTLKAE